MNKKLLTIILCVLSFANSYAVDFIDPGSYQNPCECCCPPIEGKAWLDFGNGWRQDQFKFGRSKCKTQNIGKLDLDAVFLVGQHFMFQVSGEYGRSLFTPRKSEVCDATFNFGYFFSTDCMGEMLSKVSVSPLVGFGCHHQLFKARYSGYRSNYRFTWNGPSFGFALTYLYDEKTYAYFDYQFQWDRFRARVSDHVFEDRFLFHVKNSNAYGNQVTFGAIRKVFGNFYLGLKFQYKGFWANRSHGADSGLEQHVGHVDMNWNSYYLSSLIGYEF